MKDDFATAMRRSLAEVRAGNPMAATRLIQDALSGGADPAPGEARRHRLKPGGKPPAPAVEGSRGARPAASRTRPPHAGDDAPAPVPDGALFERRRHEGPHGTRDYRLYRPSPEHGPVRGVILMLHGCTQTPEDFALGTRMNLTPSGTGSIVAYPEQTRAHNASALLELVPPRRPVSRGRRGGAARRSGGSVARTMTCPPGRSLPPGCRRAGRWRPSLRRHIPRSSPRSASIPASRRDRPTTSCRPSARCAATPHPSAEPLNAPAIIFHGSADRTVAPVNAGRLAGPLEEAVQRTGEAAGRRYDVLRAQDRGGHPIEVWRIDGAGHAWSGGCAGGQLHRPQGTGRIGRDGAFFLERD